jgi:alcohol dehydrogenase class IV
VVAELPEHLLGKGKKRPLLVTDPMVEKLPFFGKILDELQKAGLQAATFSDVHKNPIKSDVLKGDEAFKAHGADSVIGLGGGVALDVARAIVLRVNHRRDLFDYDDLLDGWKYVTDDVPYFVTIPTTAGTGSEVGRSTVISEEDTHRKRLLFAPQLLAKQVFVDPILTMELPPFITAATGMDALAHNLEAFMSNGFHPMADGIALEGVRLIVGSIEKATHNPDLTSRSHMLIGSLMGAVAFQKGLGIVHSLAHPLSSVVDAHHGTAIALMFPHGMRFNTAGYEEKITRLAYAMGITSTDPYAVADRLADLLTTLGLPTHLTEIGVTEAHLDALTELSATDFCLGSNPKPVSAEQIRELYKGAM